jgi:plasmid stability protein
MTTPKAPRSEEGLTLHRFDLPPDLAAAITTEAARNERTAPAQVRFVLRAWLANQQQQEAGQ